MITIRDYSTEDFDNYYSLNCDIIAEKKYFSMVSPFPKDSSLSFRSEQQNANRPMKVAYDGEKFLGWCDVFENDNQFNPKLGIGLHKDYRNKGIGKQLLLSVLDACQHNNYECIYLDVFKSNQRAISLYTNLGFVHIPSADSSALHNGEMKESLIMKFTFNNSII